MHALKIPAICSISASVLFSSSAVAADPVVVSNLTTAQRQGPRLVDMKATIKDNSLHIEIPLHAPRPSSTGKTLILEAHRQVTPLSGSIRENSSGRIRTKHRGDWCYGRFEVRAKLPKGQGIWPAIWMLPTDEKYGGWAASGEIDIMELLGHEPNKVMGTIHYGGAWPKNTSDGSQHFQLPSGDSSDGFHVFRLDWNESGMKWFVDDVLFRETPTSQWFSASALSPAPFNQRFHLILNLAVGGNWPGSPDSTTQFPCRMEVDWVRIYQ